MSPPGHTLGDVRLEMLSESAPSDKLLTSSDSGEIRQIQLLHCICLGLLCRTAGENCHGRHEKGRGIEVLVAVGSTACLMNKWWDFMSYSMSLHVLKALGLKGLTRCHRLLG